MSKGIQIVNRYTALCIAFIVFLGGCATTDVKQPVTSLDQAKSIVVTKLYKSKIGQRAIFASPVLKQSGVMIGTWPTPEKVLVKKDSWFFFIDEHPAANWEHPARFVLVDKQTGRVKSIRVTTPPRELAHLKPMNPIASEKMKVYLRNAKSIRDVIITKPVLIKKKKKYAVLVSGGWDANNNHARYWNDLSFIYKALKKKYHYTDSEIIVLYANGTHQPNEDLDGDGVNDIDYSATKSNLTSVMKSVAKYIRSDGKFFFYSTNHGGYESGHDAYLYLWGETIRDDEFGALSKLIKSKDAIYVMEQCYSGGMSDDILKAQTYPCSNPRVCVMSAARHDEVSWGADTEGAYDEYVYHWTSAVYGKTPTGTTVNADSNNDGIVSMKEAHEYAKAHDSRNEHPVIGSCIANACGTSLYTGLSFNEDCVKFNPDTTTVKQINGRWKVVDGSHWLFDFASNQSEANKTLSIIKHYKMNRSCFVGRPDPSFTYMLITSASPVGVYSGEDCTSFNPATAQVKQISGSWKIVDGSHWMFDFGSKKTEAQHSLEIINKYGFNRSCFVGRPGPSFSYLRK